MLAAWMAAAGGPSLAQTAAIVLSGEHDAFSRLAFRLLPDESWTVLRKGADTVVLRLDGRGPDLNVDDVFDLIPRSRIASVSAEGRTLTLKLACRCAVETFRTENGYLAIDVGSRPSKDAAAAAGPAVALPLTLEAGSILARPLEIAEAVPVQDESQVVADAGSLPPQFTVHDRRPTTLLPAGNAPTDADIPASGNSCRFEQIARRAFDADPRDAMMGFAEDRAAVLNGQDMFDRDAALGLVDRYLAIGWGAEATSILDTVDPAEQERRLLAIAFDRAGAGDATDAPLPDPVCGPASAVAFLMLGGPEDTWRRADEGAMLRYLDRLVPARRRDLLPLVRTGLSRLGKDTLLAGLDDPEKHVADVQPRKVEAGTDMAAIRGLHSRLKTANDRLQDVENIWLVNAMALLPSIPDGSYRDDLETELAKALTVARHFGEAATLTEGRPDRAVMAVEIALDALAPEDAAEALARFAGDVPAMAPVSGRAQALLAELGLSEIAARYGGGRGATIGEWGDAAPVKPEMQPDPWLSRDLAGLAADTNAASAERTRVAEVIVARNAADGPDEADYEQAGAELSRSREMRAALEALLRAGSAS